MTDLFSLLADSTAFLGVSPIQDFQQKDQNVLDVKAYANRSHDRS